MSSRRVYVNQDDSAFTRCHPIEDMTVEGLERVVDFYAQGCQLAGLAFCVNMQRALFSSRVWETLIDDADPNLGLDQPLFERCQEAAGMAALVAAGVDHLQVWLDRTRFHGVEAFLTMRMNDCHGLQSHGGFAQEGVEQPDQDHFNSHATRFWKDNPQLRRAPYRFERSFEGAFDYSHEQVRAHHLALVEELFDRYDMDGLELDWMRWIFMFAPGSEAAGRSVLTEFIGEVDRLRKRAELRYEHPILLRHRVPAEPQSALALGFDVARWSELGLVDQVILSDFGACANLDYPIEIWRRLVGDRVKIIAMVESGVAAYPGSSFGNYHVLYGAASAALERGADGVYLFNECYREAGEAGERRLMLEMLNHLGAADTLERVVRRHPVTYPQVQAPGEPQRRVLPIPLINSSIGWDPGRWAENVTLRLSIGRLSSRSRYVLRLGFSEEVSDGHLAGMSMRVNAVLVDSVEAPVYEDCRHWAFPGQDRPELPEAVCLLSHYEVPHSVLLDDVNVVEFVPPEVEGRLEWAEFIVLPE
ncbi:hypothetical protein SH580_03170 [Coraliomargarita algicola]|uniref:Glycosyl hydrolase-like 10 domain-containing protein n=1 Tax=Coraliomargarita algicola TaxID=3092156 RepID=A0ABZ0RKH0_9BACT|nr:hypothetical protein [Coraliomargarita sp. J2-16]WPJ96704.1 hypothetical protein SH580_03170 [Coraliomargarita sp. J2-16]